MVLECPVTIIVLSNTDERRLPASARQGPAETHVCWLYSHCHCHCSFVTQHHHHQPRRTCVRWGDTERLFYLQHLGFWFQLFSCHGRGLCSLSTFPPLRGLLEPKKELITFSSVWQEITHWASCISVQVIRFLQGLCSDTKLKFETTWTTNIKACTFIEKYLNKGENEANKGKKIFWNITASAHW